ncbi:RNA-binding protein 7-like [Calliphora vicina]|uniref:RNA-binding protein 7-like n=1 Tax=Calliphora vicina TaxID=7373 RepID=UPI00325BAC1D
MRQENLHEVYDESEDEDDEEKRTLFCANLDERVTDDMLYEVFLQAGPIKSARIPKDQSGRQRTFGFITYVHKCSLPYAMQLYQGLSLYRKTLTIKYQGNTQPSPVRNYNSPGHHNKRSSYDNSSLRGGNYSPYNDNSPQNPFQSSYSPDYPTGSGKHQDNISKHASSQRRAHTNTSPYQRNSTGSEDRYRDRERDRDHNRRRQHNNGGNRHSEQRSGSGKYRR